MIGSSVILCVVISAFVVNARDVPNVVLDVGGHCGAGAAPTGPGGAWQVIENGVTKICPAGTSCRKGACNCDDLPGGIVTSQSWDYVNSVRSCKRVGGQKCEKTEQCMTGGDCKDGKCVCDKTKADNLCSDEKVDIMILH